MVAYGTDDVHVAERLSLTNHALVPYYDWFSVFAASLLLHQHVVPDDWFSLCPDAVYPSNWAIADTPRDNRTK